MYYAKYAKYTDADREVMAFRTKVERDNWTRFKDEASIVCGATADNATFQRKPLTMSEAANKKDVPAKCKSVFLLLSEQFFVVNPV